MPSAFLTGSSRFVQKAALATYGGEEKIWWPATEGSEEYTVPVDCVSGVAGGKNVSLAGLTTIDVDTRSFRCTLADFPFQPAAMHFFMFGPALGSGEAFDPDTSKKFQLLQNPEIYGEQITLHATLQS